MAGMKLVTLLLHVLFATQMAATPQKLDGLYINTFGNPSHPSLIFVHGGPGYNSHDFEITTAQRLSDEGYFVVVYDQRGQGRSDKARAAEFNYLTYAEDLKKIIDRLSLKSPTLLGHSHGGPIAIKFDRQFPGVAKSVVLLGAPINFWGSLKSIFENCSQRYQKLGSENALSQLTYLYYELFINTESEQSLSFLVGSSFMHGVQCGLYQTSQPTKHAAELNKLIQQNPIKTPLNGMTTAMPGFLKNEDYIRGNYVNYILTQQGSYYGIYGSEDGLFTEIERQLIQATVGAERFNLIDQSSHSVFIDQQDKFIELVKKFTLKD